MENKTCCFSGHRYIGQDKIKEVEQAVFLEIQKCFAQGINHFCTGGALGFDTLCAKVLLEVKKENPRVHLTLLLPCKEQTRGWNKKDILIYEEIMTGADEVIYICETYEKGCMLRRNRALVDRSQMCICYLNQKSGGTYYTVCYALREGLDVLNITVAYPTCRSKKGI